MVECKHFWSFVVVWWLCAIPIPRWSKTTDRANWIVLNRQDSSSNKKLSGNAISVFRNYHFLTFQPNYHCSIKTNHYINDDLMIMESYLVLSLILMLLRESQKFTFHIVSIIFSRVVNHQQERIVSIWY